WDEDEFNCGQIYNVQKPILSDIYHREDILCKNKNSFKCWQGTECINFRSVCDGTKHCADGSDERICDNWNLHCDQFTEFRCLNNYNTYNTRNCIPRQWVCDLQDDCPHGEDESVTSCLSMDHPTFNGLETDIVDF
ncbi:low-density lipoprotein receptor-related protein 8-like, partial [Daktulosphaira vitifoliae]